MEVNQSFQHKMYGEKHLMTNKVQQGLRLIR
jgi:hypothetical protein